jgi:monoterpene epsilon-lactone hydrolase
VARHGGTGRAARSRAEQQQQQHWQKQQQQSSSSSSNTGRCVARRGGGPAQRRQRRRQSITMLAWAPRRLRWAAAAALVVVLLRARLGRVLLHVAHHARAALLRRGWVRQPAHEWWDGVAGREQPSPELLALVWTAFFSQAALRQRLSFERLVALSREFYQIGIYSSWYAALPSGLCKRGFQTARTRLGRRRDVPAVWLSLAESGAAPSGAASRERGAALLYYIHGGGYIAGDAGAYSEYCASLLAGTGCARCVAVDYTLGSHKALSQGMYEELVEAYRHVVEEEGVPGASIVLAGDSAGGGLALGLLARLRERGLPLPACAVLICPWADLCNSGTSMERSHLDAYFPARHYFDSISEGLAARHGLDLSHRDNSPLHHDLAGLPPLYVCAGASERLADDAVRVADNARRAGVAVELELLELGVHNYPLLGGPWGVPEYRAANERICAFVRRQLAAA